MRYTFRTAWRKQWFLVLIAIALLLIPAFPLIEAFQTDVGKKPIAEIFNLTLLLLALPFGVLLLIMAYRHYSARFTIEDGNIESRHGIIAREINSIRIADVRNINVKQSLLDRILFVGDIEFSSAASDNAEVIFKGVSNPMRIKRKVQEML
jgi:membrane protein YdbS with pleckstrin-like domain